LLCGLFTLKYFCKRFIVIYKKENMEAFDKLLKKMGSVCADLENSYFNVVKA